MTRQYHVFVLLIAAALGSAARSNSEVNVYPVADLYEYSYQYSGCRIFEDRDLSELSIAGVGPGAAVEWRAESVQGFGPGEVVVRVACRPRYGGNPFKGLDRVKVAEIAHPAGPIDVILSDTAIYVSSAHWSDIGEFYARLAYSPIFDTAVVTGTGPGATGQWDIEERTGQSGEDVFLGVREMPVDRVPVMDNIKVGELNHSGGSVDIYASFGVKLWEYPDDIALFQWDAQKPCELYGATDVEGMAYNDIRVDWRAATWSHGSQEECGSWSARIENWDWPFHLKLSVTGRYVDICSMERAFAGRPVACVDLCYRDSDALWRAFRRLGTIYVMLAQDVKSYRIHYAPDWWDPDGDVDLYLNREMCSVTHTLDLSAARGGSVQHPGEGQFRYNACQLAKIKPAADEFFRFESWSGPFAAGYTYSLWKWVLRDGRLCVNSDKYSGSDYSLYLPMGEDHTVQANFVSTLETIYVDDDAPGDPGPNDSTVSDPNENGTAAHPFDSIQEAIALADPALKPTVVVRSGVYFETIDYLGKNIRVTGFDPNALEDQATPCPVIDGDYQGPVVTFAGGEDPNAELSGFTLTRGCGEPAGGILCIDSSPVISNCLLIGNRSTCPGGGGGVYCRNSHATILDCTISGNYGGPEGAGFYSFYSDNIILNSILWDNLPVEVEVVSDDVSTGVAASYSDVRGGLPGEGNLDADPLFLQGGYWADPDDLRIELHPMDERALWADGDYHLHRESPCIDAGDWIADPNARDIDGEPRLIGAVIDIGSDEYMPYPLLTISSTHGGTVTEPGEGTFKYRRDEEVSVTATPAWMYHFTGWQGTAVEAGLTLDPGSASTIVTADGQHTLIATFAPEIELALHPPQAVEQTRAVLVGELVNEGGSSCECRFAYRAEGMEERYTSWAARSEGEVFEVQLDGLEPGTLYHFALEARNATTSAYLLATMTFTTEEP